MKNGSNYTVGLCGVQLEQIKILTKYLVRASKEPWKYESIYYIYIFRLFLYVLLCIQTQALVNVPAISERSIRSNISTCKTTLDSQIQVYFFVFTNSHISFYIHNLILQLNVLDEAAQHNPNARRWLKADGCDINKGLKESSRLEWSGDVDLGDGLLQEQHKNYRNRLKSAEKIGLCGDDIAQELADVLVTL